MRAGGIVERSTIERWMAKKLKTFWEALLFCSKLLVVGFIFSEKQLFSNKTLVELKKGYQLGCPAVVVYLPKNDELATFCKNVFGYFLLLVQSDCERKLNKITKTAENR